MVRKRNNRQEMSGTLGGRDDRPFHFKAAHPETSITAAATHVSYGNKHTHAGARAHTHSGASFTPDHDVM